MAGFWCGSTLSQAWNCLIVIKLRHKFKNATIFLLSGVCARDQSAGVHLDSGRAGQTTPKRHTAAPFGRGAWPLLRPGSYGSQGRNNNAATPVITAHNI